MTKKDMPISLIELPATQYGILNGELSHDIYSNFRLPSRATPLLESILREDGFSNIKSINPIFDGDNGYLTVQNYKDIFNSKIIMISSITRTSQQSMELIKRYKIQNPNGIAIAGGMDPTFRTDDWLKNGADIIVIGEGEKTILELTNHIANNKDYKNHLETINGIAYLKNYDTLFTKKRELLTEEELSNNPLPTYTNNLRKKIRIAAMETSRGCPNNCDFCSVTEFYGRKTRKKSIDSVIKGLEHIKNIGRSLFFIDDDFDYRPSEKIELLKEIKKQNLDRKMSQAQVTISSAKNDKLLETFKEANLNVLYIGIESVFNESLSHIGKPYTAEENKEAVKKLRDMGFWVHGMMIQGTDEDTLEKLDYTTEWAKQNLDSVQFFAPVPLPGTRFSNDNKDRILTTDYSLYDGQHVIIRPKQMSAYELQEKLIDMYKSFYSYKNLADKIISQPKRIMRASIYAYVKKYGINNVFNNVQTKEHLKFLKSIN